MKKMILYLLILLLMGCTQSQLSPTDTAKIVVESFYKNDNSKLKKHTTAESYASFMSIQATIAPGTDDNSNFKLIEETVKEDTAWVKFSTSYDNKSETFKLIKVDGKWLVTEKQMNEKTPF
ncbi:hypothetical protein CLV33_101392 [Jejuia pallidilutea]|uniref:DUF4878 domain-containing protein n=1 Tax=Jejuia pallidilutea TaxID=504487 RepID=A0A362X4U6_9FLAO|nr:hypothetical protein [Jejuia pallidilutea]PQV51469.1 hypothetical protein CLV33_101392 [Jejuia pallidilutea]